MSTVTFLMQQYLQQDVHINVMLWHYLPNIPFNSGHQEQHLFVVNGLGCDNPVYWFPQFTGCRHRLKDRGESAVMCVTLSRYLNIMYTVNSDEADKKSTSLLRRACCAGSVIDCTILSKVNSQDLTFIWCWRGGKQTHLCACTIQMSSGQKKKREKRVGEGQTGNFLLFLIKKRADGWVQLVSSIGKEKEAFYVAWWLPMKEWWCFGCTSHERCSACSLCLIFVSTVAIGSVGTNIASTQCLPGSLVSQMSAQMAVLTGVLHFLLQTTSH